MLAAATSAQPKVPLSRPPAVSLARNSPSAANWPTRSEATSPKLCSNQAVYSRVVGSASILLGSPMLPAFSATLWPLLWIWKTVTCVLAPVQPISFCRSVSTLNSSWPS